MTSKKLFFILIGCLMLIGVLGVAAAVVGDKVLQQKSDELTELKVESQVLQEQQESLAKAQQDIDEHAELEQIANTVVPQEKDQARTVREIIRHAEEANVQVANVSFPTSSLGQTSGRSTDDTSQISPVEGIDGVYEMEIDIQTNTNAPVPYQNLLDFLRRLEQNRRTAQVTNLTVQPTPADRSSVTFNLSLTVYIKP